jgi:hypothetical protein
MRRARQTTRPLRSSLLNSLRLLNAEDRIAAKEPAELRIGWTGVPRPDLARIRAQQPISDSTHSPVVA